ncbi:MAG: DNRLRE domain-containing protein, partial [Pirellulales bacterium]|nr:DNRLRE domain-containing protein [Pirellulales bacterium]
LALIRWDVSDIPAGSVIDGAAITVYVNDSSNGQAYEFYSANREWIDDQATWNVACTGVPWQTPGARGQLDRGSEILGVMAPTAVGSYTYALNAAGIALVQQWIDDPSTNYGLIISDENNTDGMEFDSSESATLSYRPRLTLSFRGVDDTPPSIPTGLTATDDGISSIALSWEASTDLESGIAGYRVFRDNVEIGTTTTTSFLDVDRDTNTIYSYAVLAINGQGVESGLSNPAVEHQIIPVPIQVKLSVRDSYLSDSAVLVRVAVYDPQGNIARDLWNATVTLTTDDPSVSLSTDEVALVNGLGSALVTFRGGSDFTLFATIAGNVGSRELTSLDGGPQTEVSGYQSGVWSGVVHVIGDVTVPAGQTLTLEPGTLVILDGDPVGATGSTQIVVAGTLDSRGTADQPITFTAVDPANPWGEIDIDGGTAIFDYTVVTRAGNSPRGGHTETGPAFRLHNDANLQFTNGSVANIHGKIMQATGGDVIINDSLLTRAVMGPEISATSLLFRDNWIVDMNRSWHYNNVDNDNDGIYLHTQSTGQTLSLERSVVAMVGDDCVDTLNSEVVAREMIVRDAFDKGFSINGGTILIERSLIVDTGVGIQTKGDSTFAPQTRVDRTTISGVHVGIVMRELSSSVVYDVVNTIIHVNPLGDPLLNEVAPDGNDRFHINYSLFDESWEFAGSGIGNIESNSPMFVDLAGKDFRLQANSPAVDSGDPSSTPDDDGTRADMGAFATMQHAAGDFNRDGNVDGQDLAQWDGDFGVNGESDSDGDGDSDGNDFLAWQRNFGSTSPSGSAAKSSTGSGANDHGKSMFFGIANATSDPSNNTMGGLVGLVRRSLGNGQDLFFLPPSRQDMPFDAFDDTGWSLPQPLAKSIGDPVSCLDMPHFQSRDASRPSKRCHAIDSVMSCLEGQAAQTDLEYMDRRVGEITFTDFTEHKGSF